MSIQCGKEKKPVLVECSFLYELLALRRGKQEIELGDKNKREKIVERQAIFFCATVLYNTQTGRGPAMDCQVDMVVCDARPSHQKRIMSGPPVISIRPRSLPFL